ncbi:MAG: hypothetical protein RI893_696 [Pseudomonadota bacterium]|jgi:hypothetical protein
MRKYEKILVNLGENSMNNIAIEKHATVIKSPKGELVVKGVATALAAATIIEAGKGVALTLAKHPLVMFSLGIVSGFYVHKYRKEIITITSKTAEQGKNFVLSQKDNLKDLLTETRQETEEPESK